MAELAAWIIELKADYITRREPSATVEGVRIARRATALSIEKARRELGYVARPVEPLLREMITNMAGARAGRPGSAGMPGRLDELSGAAIERPE